MKQKNLTITLLLAAIFTSCSEKNSDVPQPTPEPEPVETTVRVMFFNTRVSTADPKDIVYGCDWPARREGCFAMIKDVKPSVIGFNEASLLQLADYTENLDDYTNLAAVQDTTTANYIFYDHTAVSPVPGTSGKFWLGPNPDTSPEPWVVSETKGHDYSACLFSQFKEKETGATFWVFVTHPSYLSTVNVLKGCKLIKERMTSIVTDDSPVFLGGDMNALEWSSPVYVLRKYMAVARENAPVTDSYPTYNAWGFRSGYNDMIFLKGNLKLDLYKTVVEKYGTAPYISDHYPVYADVRIGGKTKIAIPPDPALSGETFTTGIKAADSYTTGSVTPGGLCLYDDEQTVYQSYKIGLALSEGSFNFLPSSIGDIVLSFFANTWFYEQTLITVSASDGALVNGKASDSITAIQGAESLDPDYLSPRDCDKYTFKLTGVTPMTVVTIKASLPESVQQYYTAACRTRVFAINISGGTPRPDAEGSGVKPLDITEDYPLFNQ